jgi:type I restriction enzyme S subunit
MVVKTEKKVPVLRFPMFNEDWKERNLGYFLSFKNGINARKEQYGKGIKFINVLDILNNDYITYDRIIGLVDIDEATFLKNIVSYGDILFQRSSETREDVGLANVYLDQEKNATFGGFVIRGQRINDYHPVFMNFLLKTGMARKEITSKSGGSTRYNVGQEVLSSVRIILPSLPEQQKIASFLTTIDTRIQQLSRKLDLLEQYKKGVMQQIFSQEIRFKPDSRAGSDEEGKDFPDWEERKLKEIVDQFIVPMRDKPKDLNGPIPWCRIEDFQGKMLTGSKTGQGVSQDTIKKMNLKVFPVGTLLVSCSADLGRCAIVKEPLVTNQTFIGLVPRSNHLNVDFFYYIMGNSARMLNRLSSGTTISYLSRKEFEKFKIELPSLHEQQKIADFLSAIDQKIYFTKDQLDQTKAFKRGLLQQLFV